MSSTDLAPFAEIKLRDQAFGIDVHPTRPLLTAGLVTGQLKLFEWDANANANDDSASSAASQVWSARPHKEACRVARFSADGASIFSSGGDLTLQQRDVTTNKPIWRRRDVHAASVNALTLLGDVGVATGDDAGQVTCWDLRARTAALKFHENVDYVSDMLYTEQKNKHTLLVTGGDGHLAVFDLRAGRLWARSDPQEDELLCLTLAKNGKKLLCGTQTGVVGIFSWGDFGDVSDRLLGHPASVDCMLNHGEDVVLTGSGDGLIRAVSVHPNAVLGLVGEHADESPIEALCLVCCRSLQPSSLPPARGPLPTPPRLLPAWLLSGWIQTPRLPRLLASLPPLQSSSPVLLHLSSCPVHLSSSSPLLLSCPPPPVLLSSPPLLSGASHVSWRAFEAPVCKGRGRQHFGLVCARSDHTIVGRQLLERQGRGRGR